MNHRYSRQMNAMLLKVFQVGEDWVSNMKEYPSFRDACIDKFNVAHGRTDGAAMYDACSFRVNKDQKELK